MNYDLIKITKKEYADEILKGNLYMNPLSFFRKYENDYMDDMAEGVCGDVPKNQMRQYGYYLTDEIIDNITTDNVMMISDHFSACNLYCMYSLYHDDEEQKISEFNEDLLQFSDTAVWIKDVNEFKNRVKNAIEIECVKGKAEYGSYGRVKYYDMSEVTNKMDSRSCFDKRRDYQWQQEWRICLWSHNLKNAALTLHIGDISDIACIVPAEKMSQELKKYYTQYKVCNYEDISDGKIEMYTTMSNGNVMGRLMSRYSDLCLPNIVRSDKSEALYHLSRYYELQGKLDKAEEVLKELVEKEKIWKNYQLLIRFYSRIREIRKIEKIYLDIIMNKQDILSDKQEFFYEVHQYYMSLEKAYDAGLIYTVWSNKLFPEETALALEHDIYIGLGMSDRAIEVADKLSSKYGEREILNYYYAVNYTYLLNTSKARKYLNLFQKNYSPNLKQNEYVNRVEETLDILEGKKEPVRNVEVIEGYNRVNPPKEEVMRLRQKVAPLCVIEHVTLYILFKYGCEEYLDSCKRVFITAKAVHQIVNSYCESGDVYLLRIIKFLEQDKRVTICSPALKDLIGKSLDPVEKDDMIFLMTKVLKLELEETLKRQSD